MKFDVYCDESSPDLLYHKEADKYSLIGSLWMPFEKRDDFKNSIKIIKSNYHYYSEIKWNKVSKNYKDFFIALAAFFFETNYLRFRAIIIESDKIDLIKFHKNDAELSFYKFYYQLLHHWLLDFNEYNIFLDYKTNKERFRLKELRSALSNSNFSTVIKNVQSIPSKQSLGIQFADFFVGAINSKFNSIITNEAKLAVISKIEELNKGEILPTSKTIEKFNIFKIKLQGGW